MSGEVYADTANAISIAQKKPGTDKTDKSFAENTKTNEWEAISVKFQMPAGETSKNISVWLDKGTAKARNIRLVKTDNPDTPDIPDEDTPVSYTHLDVYKRQGKYFPAVYQYTQSKGQVIRFLDVYGKDIRVLHI